ncbi:TetR family transcriptional regulator [Evansella halocellulosilytica]|uniref:TetR family transcriptional regulator n=1 Tax=Evansella halocellulosilytica TaxID=2011013 RepID=UPI000BB8957E|nr:TetR family transcriptional regulator [Evansella halocellulosilytica]
MQNKERKYELLLDSAIKVMTEKGFEKTAVSQIVKEAGVAQGTFYLYFSSKSEIIPAIAERIFNEQMNEIKSRNKSEHTFLETLNVMIDVTFEMTYKYKEVIIFCYSGIAFFHSFHRWEEIYKPYYDWVEQRLTSYIEEHGISIDIHTFDYVKMIVNAIENTAENYYFSNNDEQNEEKVSELKRQVFIFLEKTLKE